MNEWFEALVPLQQTLFAVALFSTLLFFIQTLFTFFGLGMGGGELDHSGLAEGAGGWGQGLPLSDIFTLRNGVAFLMGLSWGGLMAYEWGLTHTFPVVVIGLFTGSIFLAVNMGIFALLSLLKHEGNIQLHKAIGQQGTVSLTVPGSRSGVGKVSVSVQGRLLECHAVTDGDSIVRNSSISVKAIAGNQLVVEGMKGGIPNTRTP